MRQSFSECGAENEVKRGEMCAWRERVGRRICGPNAQSLHCSGWGNVLIKNAAPQLPTVSVACCTPHRGWPRVSSAGGGQVGRLTETYSREGMEITTSVFLLCTLVVHFLTEFCSGFPAQPAEPMPRSRTPRQVDFTSTYTHLGSNNRTKQLYCRTGYHLQLFSNGAIGGTSEDGNAYAVVHILTVEVGVAGIWGVEASRYLCMDNRGNLYGSLLATADAIHAHPQVGGLVAAHVVPATWGRGVRVTCWPPCEDETRDSHASLGPEASAGAGDESPSLA
uniref:Fibroblast growth factor n=1 Tax=Branchiostoma floridae TaxID=7739 RepID=C3Y6A9_BRAFL|eukprot:XP_002608496.1 hypothetical protein BRAFLDRAFT_92422 [Branchiostoma floridae]